MKNLDCNLLKLIAKHMRLLNVQMNNVAPMKERKCSYTDNQNIIVFTTLKKLILEYHKNVTKFIFMKIQNMPVKLNNGTKTL
jgi:uncharacterized protein with PIN domain